jgi:hypothetical protein
MSKHTVTVARMNGDLVAIVAYLESDGVVEYWETNDPDTGAHVDLSSLDKWFVLSGLRRALKQRSAA